MANKTFTHRGRDWDCTRDPAGHWTATSENPTMRICAPSWGELAEEIKAADPTNPRVDGIAAVQGLGVGSRMSG